jgi:hypothetical protein
MVRAGCRSLAALAMTLLVASAVVDSGPAAVAGGRTVMPLRITLDGVAGLAPGMTPAQVRRTLRAPIVLSDAKPGSNCRMARIANDPLRGYALFLDGRLSALFFTAGVRTDRGIEMGSPLNEIVEAYGSSHLIFWPAPGGQRSVHVYTRARYLGDGRALRFDLDADPDHVTKIGLGGRALNRTRGRC